MSTTHHSISVKYALEGLQHAVRTQPNFLIHLSIAALVIVAGVFLEIERGEWLVVALTITMGLVIELINTAIEATVDLVTLEIHPLAKIAKDTASAAMLVYACGASIVGLLIFLPKLWHFI